MKNKTGIVINKFGLAGFRDKINYGQTVDIIDQKSNSYTVLPHNTEDIERNQFYKVPKSCILITNPFDVKHYVTL